MSSSTNQDHRATGALHRSPLMEVWSQAWPTILTMTSYSVMQFVDSLMVAQVSPVQFAAQGNGGIWSFLPIAFAFGVLTVINTYVSQNLGAGKPENGPKYAWAGIWFGMIIWLCALLPFAASLPFVFGLMHGANIENREELILMESRYAQILLVGAVILLASKSLHHYFFGLHRPKIVTAAALTGNIVNVIANYVLIFGEEGLPALNLPGIPGVKPLGLYGAAIGTVIGTAVEFCIPASVFFGSKMHAELRSRSAWRPQWAPMRDILRIGWPAAVQFGNELTCWAIFMTHLVGQFGTAHMAGGWVAFRLMHLSFMPAVGCSVATTALVGRYIGAGDPDTASQRARTALTLSVIYMSICAVIFFVFREHLVTWFLSPDTKPEDAEEIIKVGARLLICAAVFQTADAFGIVYTGALRGAGDTIWPGVITIVYSWLFIIGLGWLIARLYPEWESVGPWIGASAFIILYGITMAIRFESGSWRSIKLLSPQERDAARVAPIGPAVPAADADATYRDEVEELVLDE